MRVGSGMLHGLVHVASPVYLPRMPSSLITRLVPDDNVPSKANVYLSVTLYIDPPSSDPPAQCFCCSGSIGYNMYEEGKIMVGGPGEKKMILALRIPEGLWT